MTHFDEIQRRRYVAIATEKYEKSWAYQRLTGVPDEVKIITDWLTDERLDVRRFKQEDPELPRNPEKGEIEKHLSYPDQPWEFKDAAAIYITGHGVIDDKGPHPRHYLVLEQTDPKRLYRTALATADLLGWLSDTDIEHLLVIIDVCFAGHVAEELGRRAKKNWLILPSAQKDRGAGQLALAKAISTFIKGAEAYNRHAQYLTVKLFVDAINDQLPDGQKVEPIYKGRRAEKGSDRDDYHEEHVCLPNPSYEPDERVRLASARQAVALRRDLLEIHNRVSRRLPSANQPGWLFTGRERLARDLMQAAGEPGVTMVTGSAGSGKSTALSRLVTLSDSGFCSRHAEELQGVPFNLLPPPGLVDVAVSARKKSSLEVVTQICIHLSLVAQMGSWDDALKVNREKLGGYLAQRALPVTIVIDDLDEADDPTGLVGTVLVPLATGESGKKLCLLVGVRSPEGDSGAGATADGAGEPITDLLARKAKARRIQVDDDLRWNSGDLTTFIRNILTNTEGSQYGTAADTVLAGVVEVISGFAGRSYFAAETAASSLPGRKSVVVSPDDPEWRKELEEGLLGAFRGDLQAHFKQENWRRGAAFLRAVAFARGDGLPWHQVWPRMAEAVDDIDDVGREYGDGDVRWLLGSRLNAYLATGQQDGLTVYRLIHDELRDILRYRWRELLDRPALGPPSGGPSLPAGDADISAVERRITESLHRRADVRPTTRVSHVIQPYIRRHFAEHALAGGVLDLDLPTPFVPYLDIGRLAAAINRLPERRQLDERIAWLPVVRRVTHLWDWERPARNAAAIQMWAALGEVELPGSVGGPWQVLWAAQPQDLSTVLGHQRGIVRAVAVADLPQGPVVVAGGSGGLLYTWDLRTNGRYGDRAPVDTGGKSIVAIAIAPVPDHGAIAVTGSEDGKIRFWDVAAGHAVGAPLDGGDGAIKAVATTRLPGDQVVVIASDDAGTIRTWDLASREPVGDPLPCGDGMALGITTTRVDGKVLGLATGEDSGLQIWDVVTGTADGPRLTHPLASRTWTSTLQGGQVIATEVLGGTETAITGDGDGLLLWDLRKREPIRRRLTGGDKKIRSLATTRLGGRVLGLVGASSAVQVLDLEAGEPVGDLMRGHRGSVEAVSVAALPDGSVLAVSGGRDESVRTWELPAAALAASKVSRHTESRVEDVATIRLPDGRTIVLTCVSSAVRVWELEHGNELAPLTGHESPVTCVAVDSSKDGVLAVAGHWDGTIDTWRVADGTPARHGRLDGKGTTATSLALMKFPDGRLVAVVGRRNGSVQACDPLEGTWLGEPLGGHAKGLVRVATAVTSDGRVLAISGGKDGQVRIRDLSAHLGPDGPAPDLAAVDTGQPVTSLTTRVMPDEPHCVIVGGADGTVRLLDLLTGSLIGDPWAACPGAVTAVVPGHLPGGHGAIFAGGADALVQAWNPSTGQPIGEALPVAGPIRALAFDSATASLVVGGQGVAVTRPVMAAQAD